MERARSGSVGLCSVGVRFRWALPTGGARGSSKRVGRRVQAQRVARRAVGQFCWGPGPACRRVMRWGGCLALAAEMGRGGAST